MFIRRHQEGLLQYYRDETALNKINNIISFPANNNKFKFKQQNRKQEHKKYWHNGSIKICKWFFENTWNVVNHLWN